MIYCNKKPKPIDIIKAVCVIEGNSALIFNDKLKDGRRSFKIWGWTNKEYRICVDKLREYGYNVAVRYKNLNPGQLHRLWVR